MSQGLSGVRKVATERKQERFTALLHHLSVDLLRDSFYGLKRKAAPGVDGVTWKEYETGLEDRLVDLHGRVHRGTYRAQPSRRVYMQKADGRQRPLHRSPGGQDCSTGSGIAANADRCPGIVCNGSLPAGFLHPVSCIRIRPAALPLNIRGRSRMREFRSSGSVRGVPGNRHSYRDRVKPSKAGGCRPRSTLPARLYGQVASPRSRAKDQFTASKPCWMISKGSCETFAAARAPAPMSRPLKWPHRPTPNRNGRTKLLKTITV